MKDGAIIFSGTSNSQLARDICGFLGMPLGRANIQNFSDGEILVEIGENVRGKDVYVIQSTCYPVNDNIMQLLLMIDALKRASAEKITAVIPYFGYARQDRKVKPRVPISAKTVALIIESLGAKRVVTVDLHANQIQGFFEIPVDNLFAQPVLLEYVNKELGEIVRNGNLVVISPDAGGVERARAFAKRLDCGIAIVDKRRDKEIANLSEVMNIIGDVEGKTAILFDDMIDTAGTITQAANAIKEKGATRVLGAGTHAVLSGPAIKRINNSVLEKLIVTDTISPSQESIRCEKLVYLSSAKLIGEAIKEIHTNGSVSELFK